MKNRNIFIKFLMLFIFLTVVVAEGSLPFVGSDTPYSLSFFLFLMLIRFTNINDLTVAFIYGLFKDSINTIYPFGFFSLLYIVYFSILKFFKNQSYTELVFGGCYVLNYVICTLNLHSFDLWGLLKSIIFYILIRIITLFLFKN